MMKPLHLFANGVRGIKISAASPDMERRRIEAELARVCEAREQAAREAMADPETWYRLRRLYPSPATLEGGASDEREADAATER